MIHGATMRRASAIRTAAERTTIAASQNAGPRAVSLT